jgi:hypothetical protein
MLSDYRIIEYRIGEFKKLSDYWIWDLSLNLSDSEKLLVAHLWERDTPFKSILLAVEMDTPGTSILLAIERDTHCTSMLLALQGETPCTSILLAVEGDNVESLKSSCLIY